MPKRTLMKVLMMHAHPDKLALWRSLAAANARTLPIIEDSLRDGRPPRSLVLYLTPLFPDPEPIEVSIRVGSALDTFANVRDVLAKSSRVVPSHLFEVDRHVPFDLSTCDGCGCSTTTSAALYDDALRALTAIRESRRALPPAQPAFLATAPSN